MIFKQKKLTAYEAMYEAQRIAYAPIIFQAVRALRDLGVFTALQTADSQGISLEKLCQLTKLSRYGVETLLETGLSCGVVEQLENGQWQISKVGYYLQNDPMTRVNMDYNHYVCYQGLYDLDKSIQSEKPEGLKVFNKLCDADWETLYQALPHLPDKIKTAWYDFDHFYSDSAYPAALPILFCQPVRSMVDIGTNIGKFAILTANYNADVKITMIDLPDQLENAIENVAAAGFSERIKPLAMDLLDPEISFPQNQDVYWLSQFLSCFGHKEIVQILKHAKAAMGDNSRLYIMETCWDRQQHEAAAFSLVNTSPYFTCMASGNSKMYSSTELLQCLNEAGLDVVNIHDNLGICHSLFECRLPPKN
ncbi:MAG: SAM-dependent methyltransferase [Xanthomonadales bacterium]|nr:SAM-dependent methyltransferase [Xanthomonadales bacterium]